MKTTGKPQHSPQRRILRDESPVPLYYRLEQDLRDRILRGEFGEGGMLPIEEELGKSYGVSRITVRRAIDGLLAQRLVIKKHGVGTFVAPAVGSVQSVRLIGYMDDTLAYTKTLTYRVLSRTVEQPSPMVASALQIREDSKVIHIEMLVQDGKLPFAYSNFYFPEEIGQLIHKKDIVSGVTIVRLVEMKLGQRINRGEQTVRAIVADPGIAKHLGIKTGMPILQALRTYYTASGMPVELAMVRYHPDRYDFTVDLVTHPTVGGA